MGRVLAFSLAGMSAAELAAVQLHGTGTSLGDPIEVGALAAVIAEGGPARSTTLALLAGKALIGHSEPAAGVMGIAHAHLALALGASLPILHLSSINPYITAAAQPGRWSMLRQPGALPAPAAATAQQLASGVSSFAFQGTNAHALLAQAPAPTGAPRPAGATWQRSRYWVLPEVFGLPCSAQASAQQEVFSVALAHPRVAFMQEVVFRSVPVLTLGTVLELAGEAVAQLSSAQPACTTLASVVALPASLDGVGSKGGAAVLQCAVQPRAGAFELALLSSSHAAVCGSGRMSSCATVPTASSLRTTSRASAASSFSWLPHLSAGFEGSALVELAAGPSGSLQSAAVGPTVVDAALQPTLLRYAALPSSAEAVCIAAGEVAAQHATCTPQQAGSAVALQDSSGSFCLELAGVGRALGALPTATLSTAAKSAVPPAAEPQRDQLLYGISWQAASPAAAASTPAATGSTFRGKAGSLLAASHALAWLQSAVRSAPGAEFTLNGAIQPLAVPPRYGGPRGIAAAAVAGMLKAVAQEVAGFAITVRHQAAAAGPAWSAALASRGSASAGDAYGTASLAGLLHVPRLLPQPASATAQPLPQQLSGSFAITGGSGALGSYVALWLMQSGSASVHLCSRSGAAPAAVVQAATAFPAVQLAAHKVDAALGIDVAGLLGSLVHQPLGGIIHAGGVLEDATLANQNLASLRQVSRVGLACSICHWLAISCTSTD